jgi:hypothetical protein
MTAWLGVTARKVRTNGEISSYYGAPVKTLALAALVPLLLGVLLACGAHVHRPAMPPPEYEAPWEPMLDAGPDAHED